MNKTELWTSKRNKIDKKREVKLAHKDWQTMNPSDKINFMKKSHSEKQVKSYLKSMSKSGDKRDAFIAESDYTNFLYSKVIQYSAQEKAWSWNKQGLYCIYQLWLGLSSEQKSMF